MEKMSLMKFLIDLATNLNLQSSLAMMTPEARLAYLIGAISDEKGAKLLADAYNSNNSDKQQLLRVYLQDLMELKLVADSTSNVYQVIGALTLRSLEQYGSFDGPVWLQSTTDETIHTVRLQGETKPPEV